MKPAKNVLYSFDSFTVEPAERRLWRDKTLIQLTPKAFDTLLVLLANKGKIVEKDVLLEEVWQDTFVEESTLAQNISTLRKALGVSAEGRQFIETVPRRGYRFAAEVRELIGDEEIIVVERRTRTQISVEQEKNSDEIVVQPAVRREKVSLAQNLAAQFRQHKSLFVVSIVIFCAAVAAAAFAVRSYLQPANLSASSFKKIEISQLTSDGNISLVRISPDGSYLALVENSGENFSLQLRQVENSTTIEIVPPKKQQFLGMTFSPDSKNIYYATYDNENQPGESIVGKLYKVSTLGGQVQEIIDDIDSPITISPDGRRFAFIRNYPQEKQSAVMTAAFAGKEAQKLTFRPNAEPFSPTGLAWSPDGKVIIAPAFNENSQTEIIAIDAATGEQKSLTTEKWLWAGFTNWLADGSGVVMSAYSSRSGNQTDEIWEISYPDGVSRKIADGTNGIFGLSLTADAKMLVAVKSQLLSSFWISPASDLKQAVKIKQNLPDYNINMPGMNFTPDGKIIYGATLNGNLDVWMMDADGAHNRQIISGEAADSMAVVSPDGQDIFFISNESGRQNLWRMKADGSGRKQLTDETGVNSPSLSAAGKNIFYSAFSKSASAPVLRRISADGGDSVQMTSVATLLPQISPDGKFIACYYPKISTAGNFRKQLKLTILSAETAQIVKQFDAELGQKFSPLVWSDDKNFYYVIDESGGGARLWRQSIDNDSPELILDSPDEKIFRLACSRDGQRLAFEKGKAFNDVILIKSVEN